MDLKRSRFEGQSRQNLGITWVTYSSYPKCQMEPLLEIQEYLAEDCLVRCGDQLLASMFASLYSSLEICPLHTFKHVLHISIHS